VAAGLSDSLSRNGEVFVKRLARKHYEGRRPDGAIFFCVEGGFHSSTACLLAPEQRQGGAERSSGESHRGTSREDITEHIVGDYSR